MIFLGDIHNMNKIFDIIDKNDLKDCNIIQVGDMLKIC